MIFHHPEFLFDLRPHTCRRGGQTACPSVPFGSLSSSSCAQSPALGPSEKPAHTAVRACKRGAYLPRWLVLSQHIVHRRQGCKLGIRRKAKSPALRYVARIEPSGQCWLPSYRCRCSPLLVASASFTRRKLFSSKPTSLPQPFQSCPRTPTN